MDKYDEFKQIGDRIIEINNEEKELKAQKKLLEQNNEKKDLYQSGREDLRGIGQVL